MENANVENRNNPIIMNNSRRSCSVCRGHGHNSRTCNANRLREFELECAIKCMTLEQIDFERWLYNTYDDTLLKSYVLSKCIITNLEQDLRTCIHEIGKYIYRKYKFQYVDEYSELDFINDMEQIIFNRSQQTIAPVSEEDMIASLTNDIYSAIYFQRLMQTIQLQNYGNMVQIAFQESSLIRQYNIENVLEKTETETESIECCICYDEYKRQDIITFGCNHEFCKDCTKKSLRAKPSCAYCRASVTKLICRTQDIQDEIEELVI
jgi:hypothetical protein